jgi:hypothetical protein
MDISRFLYNGFLEMLLQKQKFEIPIHNLIISIRTSLFKKEFTTNWKKEKQFSRIVRERCAHPPSGAFFAHDIFFLRLLYRP